MEELIEKIIEGLGELPGLMKSKKKVDHKRARLLSLRPEKQFKEYRKISIISDKK